MIATLKPPPPHRTIPDFRERADPALLPELMDGPCTYEQFRACVRDIAVSSRLTLAYRPTLQFLERASRTFLPGSSTHLVDVGSGGGDTLRRVAVWARRRRLPMRFTGIDINPYATRAAEEFSSSGRKPRDVEWLTGDVFTHPATQKPDLVMSSLVTHHMGDLEVVRFLRWMEEHATCGWFVSDLLRSPRSYRLFRVLARTLRWHPFVQHDGLVSIRRAFREEDWERLLLSAGIATGNVTFRRDAPGRLTLTKLR